MRIYKTNVLCFLILINSYLTSAELKKCSKKESDAFTLQLKENIDPEIDPCDDFHGYSCGKWFSNNSKDTLSSVEFKLKSELRTFFENDANNLTVSAQKTRDIYKACLNSDFLKKNESYAAYIEVLEGFSNWPILNANWDPNTFNWIKSVANLHSYGVNAIIREVIRQNPTNNSQSVIYLVQPTFDYCDEDILLSSSTLASAMVRICKRYIKNMMLDLGLKNSDATKVSREIVSFERKMAKIMLETPMLSVPSIQTLDELQSKFPKIDFIAFFNILFSKEVDPSQIYIAAQEDYIRKLENLIERSSNNMLAQYLVFKLISHFTDALKYDWEKCVNDMASTVPELLVEILKTQPAYQNFESSKNVVHSLVDNLKKNFKTTLDRNNWLDPKTKEIALLKLENLNVFISDETDIYQELFGEIDINAKNYHQIKLEISKFKSKREHLKFLKHEMDVEAMLEPYYKITAATYYITLNNSIGIPISIMQPPFLRNDCADPGLFGNLGSLLGHELVQAFDKDRFDYDQHGNVKSWASAELIRRFDERSQCFSSQYENDKFTINENLADNAGLRLAFETFEQFSHQNLMQMDNDKHNLRKNQVFFISYAQVFCGTDRGDYLHTGLKDRVNNAVRNLEKFSEAFGCPVGSKMNPNVKKCQLW